MVIEASECVPQAGREPSDQSLLRRFKTGDQQAAAGLYRRYCERVKGFVKARWTPELAGCLEPDDILQSVFGAFFRKASEGHYAAPTGDDFWGLLMVMTLNKIRSKIAFYSAAKRQASLTFGGEDFDRLMNTADSDDAAGQFLQVTVRDVLDGLPPIHASMMELRLQGYEIAEIADKTERSKRSVERVLQTFRQHLEAVLRQD